MIDRDKVARAIAYELGDDLDHAFASKADWIDARGMKGGRFRDTNEPYRSDYLDAADAAIAAVLDQLREPLLELASDLEAEVRDRWGDDIRLAHKVDRDIASAVAVRAFLQPPDSSNPAE